MLPESAPSTPPSRDEQFLKYMERVVADNAEILRRLALGPGVEDTVLIEQKIVAEAIAAEQARIGAQARVVDLISEFTEFRLGRRVELGPSVDDYFFEEDEPVEDVVAAFEAGEKALTEPPTHGVGWCSPSP